MSHASISERLKAKRGLGGMTMKRQKAKAGNVVVLALEASSWINSTLGLTPAEVKDATPEKQVDAFFSSIESGVVLCQLMNKVNDKIPCKFQVPKADAKNAQFIARDNLANFIAAAKQCGVPNVSVFEADDLVLRKNELLVANTILKLARLAVKFGVQAPLIVQYEMEIEALEKEDKEAGDDLVVEEAPAAAAEGDSKTEAKDQDHGEYEVEDEGDEEGADAEEGAAAAAATTETAAAEPAAEAKAETAAAAAAEPAKAKEGGAGVKFVETAAEAKAPKQVSSPKGLGGTMRKRSRPLYKPDLSDDIDVALSIEINTHDWNIDIKKLAVKNKKRERALDKKGRKGEYKIGTNKVFVRVMQKQVMVRWQNDWVALEPFVKSRILAELNAKS